MKRKNTASKKSTVSGKRYPLNMRSTLELRSMLVHSAKLSGRSLAQEVEYRVEHSFQAENNWIDLLGGPEMAGITMLVCGLLRSAENKIGKRLVNDKHTYSVGLLQIYGILNKIGPMRDGDEREKYLRQNKSIIVLDAIQALLKYGDYSEDKIKAALSALTQEKSERK